MEFPELYKADSGHTEFDDMAFLAEETITDVVLKRVFKRMRQRVSAYEHKCERQTKLLHDVRLLAKDALCTPDKQEHFLAAIQNITREHFGMKPIDKNGTAE